MRQIDPDVVPVYPITPQTPMIEGFAKLVADGLASSELMFVESEHSAMSAALGAAVAGARTMTATSSQGLALMAEVVYIAAAQRAPIVVAVGNRALSGPINIHCDHSDSMLVRDAGVVQLFAENAQEAYDLMLAAPRIAEHPEVMLPVFVCQDGFTVTHCAEPVSLLEDEQAARFVGTYDVPNPLLDHRNPATHGTLALPDYYYELKFQEVEAMRTALRVMPEVLAELETLTGRLSRLIDAYALDDADRAVVVLGASAGTVKDVVDELRNDGERVGVLRVCSYRPFPHDAVRAVLRRRRVGRRPRPLGRPRRNARAVCRLLAGIGRYTHERAGSRLRAGRTGARPGRRPRGLRPCAPAGARRSPSHRTAGVAMSRTQGDGRRPR